MKKQMWLWKADDYSRTDLGFQKHKRRTHQILRFRIRAPNKIKSLVGLEYSHFVVGAYKVKVPSVWIFSIPLENARVCLYQFNKFTLYLEAFNFRMRLPFNPFVKKTSSIISTLHQVRLLQTAGA